VIIRASEWDNYFAKFPRVPGVRQIMEISIERAMTSCGYGPRLEEDNLEERDTLRQYWRKMEQRGDVSTQAQCAQHRRPSNRRSSDSSNPK